MLAEFQRRAVAWAARPLGPAAGALAVCAIYLALLAAILGHGAVAAAGAAGLAAALAARGRLRLARGAPAFVVLAACAASFPFFVRSNPYWNFTAALSALYFLAALGVNIQVGSAGIANLAGAAFFGTGAYTAALLATRLHWPSWATVPSAVATAAGVGALLFIPVLKTRGYYLALVTIAFGVVFTLLLTNMGWEGGPQGVKDVPGLGGGFDAPVRLGAWTLPFYARYFWLAAALAALGAWTAARLAGSRRGAHWNAVRDDEVAARCAGVDADLAMLGAFSAGNVLIGLAGGLYAHLVGFVAPADFNFAVSLVLLSIPILGGLDSVAGTGIGAGLLIFLAERLRSIADYRFLIYGTVIVAILAITPEGLLPPPVRRYAGLGRRGRASPDGAPADASAPASSGYPGGARLDVEDVAVRFGGLVALAGVTLSAVPGEALGIIGPNGSGKTTLFNAVFGLCPVAGGRILVDGRPVTGLPPHRIARLGLARTFQQNRVLGRQSVLDNVLLGRGDLAVEEALSWLRMLSPELVPRVDEAAADLPLIDRRRIELARALMTRPRLLLLDEPTAGLNPEETARMIEDIRAARAVLPGLTVVIIEHDMSVIAGLSDRVVALSHGRVVTSGTLRDVSAHPEVLEAYLGVAEAVL
jgi:ABC-type branched-subunit amino acid transport system ATPase component/ABC-type branched-subunit amino acid transport system permease subunit